MQSLLWLPRCALSYAFNSHSNAVLNHRYDPQLSMRASEPLGSRIPCCVVWSRCYVTTVHNYGASTIVQHSPLLISMNVSGLLLVAAWPQLHSPSITWCYSSAYRSQRGLHSMPTILASIHSLDSYVAQFDFIRNVGFRFFLQFPYQYTCRFKTCIFPTLIPNDVGILS